MRMSYSRVETFNSCPYKFYLSYVKELKTLPTYDPADARIIGTALHTGIEKDTQTAIEEYYAQYPVIDDKHIEEAIKLEYVIEKAKEILPDGEYERMITVSKPFEFIGFMDLLVKVGRNEYDLYDFKYSNNIERYMESSQLHVYRYFFEKATGSKIRNMYFVFAPKVAIRLKKTETLEDFRIRLRNELEQKDVLIQPVEYDLTKVKDFIDRAKFIDTLTPESNYSKNPSKLCDWCDYQAYCESDGTDTLNIIGVDDMQLPKNERRQNEGVTKKKIWLYGAPFSGKTYLANQFPDPLMLNTDGNVKFVDAPYIPIRDEVTTEGRITKRTYAWEVFKDAITELEKKDNGFKTIVVDVLGDIFEACRTYEFNKLGIEHESDSGYGKGWSMIKKEFMDTMQRLLSLDYDNIILISHEDMSKDVTKKSGDKITSVKPANSNQYADWLAGRVDIVARIINDEGNRTISFKTNEFVFGGGRLNIKVKDIPCTYEDLCSVYEVKKKPTKPVEPIQTEDKPTEPTSEETPVEIAVNVPGEESETATVTPTETPKRRTRRKVKVEE